MYIGDTQIGRTYTGRTYIGRTYTGRTYIGWTYTGRTFIGGTYHSIMDSRLLLPVCVTYFMIMLKKVHQTR